MRPLPSTGDRDGPPSGRGNGARSAGTCTDWKTITDDVINARVWEGVHLRTSDIAGADQGLRVARWELGRLAEIGL